VNLTLYYAPVACSLVPYITLTEAGTPFTVETVNLRAQQQMSAAYLKLNPKHKVPVLVVDGKTLTENIAIQQFIARSFPAAKLLPSDPWLELQAIALMSWCAAGIHPFLTRINSPIKVSGVAGTEESVTKIAMDALDESFKILDAKLAGHEFFFDHFTACDAYFYWCFRRGVQLGVKSDAYPNCAAHFARMEQRPSVKKALQFEKDTMAAFAKPA
jgi:glutathione S-transferase